MSQQTLQDAGVPLPEEAPPSFTIPTGFALTTDSRASVWTSLRVPMEASTAIREAKAWVLAFEMMALGEGWAKAPVVMEQLAALAQHLRRVIVALEQAERPIYTNQTPNPYPYRDGAWDWFQDPRIGRYGTLTSTPGPTEPTCQKDLTGSMVRRHAEP